MTVDSASDRPRGDALILFGITGDLGASKIIPALGELARAGHLDGVPVVGVGRSSRSDDEIEAMMRDALDTTDSDLVERIGLRYVSGDAADPSTFEVLADRLGDASTPVVYAALPPAAFGDIARAIDASSMPDGTRLVLEKPFGDDAGSAEELHRDVARSIGEDNLFIVDHFLAKAAVENLLTVRTKNAMFDHLLRRRVIGSVTVEMLERGDVTGRGSFYEAVGVVDDVVQNHVLQMAAFALMEPPSDDDESTSRTMRAATLDAMTIDPDSIVMGQYAGYRDHDDVADDSDVATFASFTVHVDTERWRDVPIHVVTGKALDRDSTSVTFDLAGPGENSIRFGVKPDPAISVSIAVLDTDADHHDRSEVSLSRREAVLCGPSTHGEHELGDYATLLDDALDGAHDHFAGIDDIVSAWRLVDALRVDGQPRSYPRGSSGPA